MKKRLISIILAFIMTVSAPLTVTASDMAAMQEVTFDGEVTSDDEMTADDTPASDEVTADDTSVSDEVTVDDTSLQVTAETDLSDMVTPDEGSVTAGDEVAADGDTVDGEIVSSDEKNADLNVVPASDGGSVSENATGHRGLPDGLKLEIEQVDLNPPAALFKRLRSSSLPASYKTSDLPALRNQGAFDTCWAHTAIALAEISLIKQGYRTSSLDLSELQLAYFTYNPVTDPLGGTQGDKTRVADSAISAFYCGGNQDFAAAALAGWLGAVDEERAPYSWASSTLKLDDKYAYSYDTGHLAKVQKAVISPDDTAPVKKLIYENGAAAICYYADNNYYDQDHNSYYVPNKLESNHESVIVGWDDGFSRDHFGNTPPGDGAWLIRNSWTTDNSKSFYGYFWMSYYDKTINESAYSYVFAPGDDYDNNYRYDGGIVTCDTGYSKAANVFTAHAVTEGTETLKAASFETLASNVNYRIDVYLEPDEGDPESGTLASTVTGTTTYAGYYQIPLSDEVVVNPGDVFSVVVTLSKQDGSKPTILAELPYNDPNWFSSTTKALKGESYGFWNSKWNDYGEKNDHNFRIKAFTDNSEAPEPPGPVEDPWGDILEEDRAQFAGSSDIVPYGLWIAGLDKDHGYEYKNGLITPEVRVYYNKRLLKAGTDYTVAYANNKNAYLYKYGEKGFSTAKSPRMTVTGKGNYLGSVTEYFTINPVSIGTVKAPGVTYAYNGRVQKGTTTVTFDFDNEIYKGRVTLKSGTDFTLSYPKTDSKDKVNYDPNAFKAPGEYEVTITGKGNYTGTAKFKETIIDSKVRTLITKAVAGGTAKRPYDGGNPIKPVTLTYSKVLLKGIDRAVYDTLNDSEKAGYDYIYEYSNNTDVGKASVFIEGINNFVGTRTVTFDIYAPNSLSKIKYGGSWKASNVYTKNEIKQDTLTLNYNGAELRGIDRASYDALDKTSNEARKYDYTYTYTNNINKGTAYITYTGINSFAGTLKRSFTITAYNIKNNDGNRISIALEGSGKYSYLKGGVKPLVKVMDGSTELIPGVDYSLSYANNTLCNTKNSEGVYSNTRKIPTLYVNGKGNYVGQVPVNFEICTSDQTLLSENRVNMIANDKQWANRAGNYTTSVVLTDSDGKVLKAGTDFNTKYEYFYEEETHLPSGEVKQADDPVGAKDIVPAGTGLKVRVTLRGNYSGSLTASYRVVTSSIVGGTARITTQYYKGTPVRPGKDDIVLMVGGRVLAARDYSIVSYGNNENKGTGTVTLQGLGNYGGLKTFTFTISALPVRSSGSTLIFDPCRATSGSMAAQLILPGKDYKLAANRFARLYHTFAGWNTKPDGTGTAYANKDTFRINNTSANGIVTLYAQWTPIVYSISYNTGIGNTYAPNTVRSYTTRDEDIILYAPDDWPVGYAFDGWFKDAKFKTRITGITMGSYGNLTLYAKWVAYKYKVSYNINAPDSEINARKATGSMADEIWTYGVTKALTANRFKRTGYVFKGWGLSPDGDVVYKNCEKRMNLINPRNDNDGSVILYAVWQKK